MRNIDVRETSTSCLSHAPNWGPATQVCALTGNQTGNLSGCGTMPNPLSHTSQSMINCLNIYQKLTSCPRFLFLGFFLCLSLLFLPSLFLFLNSPNQFFWFFLSLIFFNICNSFVNKHLVYFCYFALKFFVFVF